MNKNNKTSFTSANSLPLKIFKNKDLVKMLDEKKIIPLHIQFMPTNVCNANCPFCSCANRNKSEQMDWEMCKDIIIKMSEHGARAVTVTGGGEPILYPHFNEMIDLFKDKGYEIGLVSNGIALNKVPTDTLYKITWCRISNGDHREFNEEYKCKLEDVVSRGNKVDWAFSHVLSDKPNMDSLERLINFANEHKFTHVRIVSDIYNPNSESMNKVIRYMKDNNIDDSKVIYQDRTIDFTKGTKNCWTSLLKPVIVPDGNVFACCGMQYAYGEDREMKNEWSMGNYLDYLKKIDEMKPFDGSKCIKCFYNNYNTILETILQDIEHEAFV